MRTKKQKSFGQNSRNKIVLLGSLIIIVLGISIFIMRIAWKTEVAAIQDSFESTLENQKQETYQTFYQTSYDKAEKKYHVEDNVTISVEQVKEEAELEVLQVSDIDYVINENNWTAISGYGVYTVDLKQAEYLVDNERQYVLVRVPAPKLKTASLNYEYETFYYKDGIFNGSTKGGVDQARADLQEAEKNIKYKLSTTQLYDKSARTSAQTIVSNLVKSFNPEADNLVVDVEITD